MNQVYQSYFPEGPPSRATLITRFVVRGLLVEIEAITALDLRRPEYICRCVRRFG